MSLSEFSNSLICLFVSGCYNIFLWRIIFLCFIIVLSSSSSRLIELQELHETKTHNRFGLVPRVLILIMRPSQQ
jgi:hypothetical protein